MTKSHTEISLVLKLYQFTNNHFASIPNKTLCFTSCWKNKVLVSVSEDGANTCLVSSPASEKKYWRSFCPNLKSGLKVEKKKLKSLTVKPRQVKRIFGL